MPLATDVRGVSGGAAVIDACARHHLCFLPPSMTEHAIASGDCRSATSIRGLAVVAAFDCNTDRSVSRWLGTPGRRWPAVRSIGGCDGGGRIGMNAPVFVPGADLEILADRSRAAGPNVRAAGPAVCR